MFVVAVMFVLNIKSGVNVRVVGGSAIIYEVNPKFDFTSLQYKFNHTWSSQSLN